MEEFHIRHAANDLHTRRHEWVDRPGRVGMIMRRQEVFFPIVPANTKHDQGDCRVFCAAGHGGSVAVYLPSLIFVSQPFGEFR
jgi:hypothetical protein